LKFKIIICKKYVNYKDFEDIEEDEISEEEIDENEDDDEDDGEDDDEQDDEDDEDEEEDEEMDGVKSITTERKKSKPLSDNSKYYKAPTNEEIQQLRETTELFNTNIFRLQVNSLFIYLYYFNIYYIIMYIFYFFLY